MRQDEDKEAWRNCKLGRRLCLKQGLCIFVCLIKVFLHVGQYVLNLLEEEHERSSICFEFQLTLKLYLTKVFGIKISKKETSQDPLYQQ